MYADFPALDGPTSTRRWTRRQRAGYGRPPAMRGQGLHPPPLRGRGAARSSQAQTLKPLPPPRGEGGGGVAPTCRIATWGRSGRWGDLPAGGSPSLLRYPLDAEACRYSLHARTAQPPASGHSILHSVCLRLHLSVQLPEPAIQTLRTHR